MLAVLVDSATGTILQRMQLQDNEDLLRFDTPTAKALECSADVFSRFKEFYLADTVFVERPARVSEFHEWDAVTRSWTPVLAKARQETAFRAAAEYRRRKELPILYDGKTLDTDDEAREQLMFKAFEFAERVRLNQPAGAAARVWENADNTFFVFDTDIQFRNWLGGFVITLSNRTAQQRLALRTHVQNIKALTTVEDILAYDITVGWPL